MEDFKKEETSDALKNTNAVFAMEQQQRNQRKRAFLELELQRRRAIERMLREGRRSQPPESDAPIAKNDDVSQIVSTSAAPSGEQPSSSSTSSVLPLQPPQIERSISHQEKGVQKKPKKLFRASTVDYQASSPKAPKKRLKHRHHRKNEKEDEEFTSPDEPSATTSQKRRNRPTTSNFRPKTVAAASSGKARNIDEDLEKSVESIIARRRKTDGSSSSSAFSIPRPSAISPSSPPIRVTTINEEDSSTPPFSPILVASPPPPLPSEVHVPPEEPSKPAMPEITIDSARSSHHQEMILSPREQFEVMLDIDTSAQKPDPEAPPIDEPEELTILRNDGIKIVAPSASIEIHEPSDESIFEEEPTGISSFLTVPSEATSRRSSSFDSEDARSEIQSRLSFIVQAKLHHYANDLRRRTSQVMEEVIQMDEDAIDDDESEAGGAAAQDQQASLMSLIGFDPDADVVPEAAARSRCFPHHIDPFSKKYLLWLLVVVMAFFYNSFVIPLRTTFPYQTDENLLYWMFSDYFCDSIYLFDMIFIKPRLIFMRGGVTITNRADTRKHYLVSQQFKLDLACLLPLEVFYIFAGPVAAFRVSRMLKIYSFWEFFDLLDSSFSNPYVIRITRTFCYMIYIIHCNCCVYYMLSAWQAFGQLAYKYKGQWYLNKWVYNNQGNAYIRCFYFTAAVATSTGNNPSPTNVIEFAYMTFSWMMGVFVFALLLGQIRDIVYNANKNAEEFRSTMDKALGECKRLELPAHVQEKVRAWFMYTWEQQKTLDESKLVNKLPLKLQTDLALSVHYTTLSKVQLFQDCDRSLLRDLVLKLRPVIFLPGEMVCNKGDVGKEMYIVNQGVLEVVSDEKDKVFATLGEGVAFGEISLLAIGGNNRRTANIRSKGYSTLFVLSKEDLNDVIKDYPEAAVLLKKKAKQMLKKDKTKSSKSRKDLRDDLVKISSVSAALPTPRMLQAVAQLLPKESDVAKELQTMLHKSDMKPNRLKRWSTIPDDVSDISDTEFPKQRLSGIHKSRSLDEGDFNPHKDENMV